MNKKESSIVIKKIRSKNANKRVPKGVNSSKNELSDTETGKAGTVSIRMYCIGTGDCFVVKFYRKDAPPFTMMIDCGSCVGDKEWFNPYIENLATYVNHSIDLLVVTHEHQDHVNGFQKCKTIFESIKFKNAWFAWTENPNDPGGAAAELQKRRKEMKAALGNAFVKIKQRESDVQAAIESTPFPKELRAARQYFIEGLDSLVNINLDEKTTTSAKVETTGRELAGMRTIKDILIKQKTKISYLTPGTTVNIDELVGVKFHVLGPPTDRKYIYKEGKEGKDVYRKAMNLDESSFSAKAFNGLNNSDQRDIPFSEDFIVKETAAEYKNWKNLYDSEDKKWRNIDDEWLQSAGTLAIRLTSHINNTSLALAIESETSGKVILMPGDAEYGSWESWHLINSWDKKGADGIKHFVEDLLNHTAFYKVGHHLSYNGTALEKGISMMPEQNMVAMATLDRKRISSGWKSTMPNKYLLEELIRRTGGRFFIMNELEVEDAPSLILDPNTIADSVYRTEERADGKAFLYKQYTLKFH